jgi:hypothetical protein
MMPSYTPFRFHWGACYVYGPRFRGHVERDHRGLRDAFNACLARADGVAHCDAAPERHL